MNIEMHGTLSSAIQEHVTDRVEAALGQHEHHIGRVMVRLEDLNGPKGGIDQRCHITIAIPKHTDVIIDERGEDAYATISHAADRAKNAVGRLLEKVKEQRVRSV